MMAAGRAVFRCARGGLVDVLRSGSQGGYDGAGSWTVRVRALRDPDEQLLVETHEGLHHELQASTSWGLTSAMARLLAGRGVRSYALGEVFDEMVAGCTRTHELFATTLSAAMFGLDRGRELLVDNVEYSSYFAEALALVPVPDSPWQLRETAFAALVRCAMAPRAVADALGRGFGALQRGAVVVESDRPDVRLATFAAGAGPAGWARLLEDLRDGYPDLVRGGPTRREIPDDPAVIEGLREFEEGVLLRACYEYVAGHLAAAGSPSVGWAEHAAVAERLIAEVRLVDEELSDRLALVTQRRPIADDGLEYDRQRVELRGRLDLEIVVAEDTVRLQEAFALPDGSDRYTCGLWLNRDTFSAQFGLPPDETGSAAHLVCLVAAARDSAGTPVIRVGLLPPTTSPGELQRLLGPVPLVAVTSHTSLIDSAVRELLADDEPIFVVMDLPFAWHVGDWIRQGAKIRMAVSPLAGLPVELWLAVVAIDLAPHLRFLLLGGKAGTAVQIDQVMRRYEQHITVDNRLLGDGTELAVRAILSSWRVLEQDSVA